jgi:hypothetical protein
MDILDTSPGPMTRKERTKFSKISICDTRASSKGSGDGFTKQ